MQSYFKVEGGNKLTGSIEINGAKNSILALLIASSMTNQVVTIEDVQNIKDVRSLIKKIKKLNSTIIINDNSFRKTIILDNKNLKYRDLFMDEISEFRASYYFIGAMIGRYKKCNLLLPGGCFLGPRPIDLHLKGFEELGCTIIEKEENGKTKLFIDTKDGLHGSDIFLDFPSVGATINIMLAATLAEGTTTIENAAKEPEIIDVATMLTSMGAIIKGAGTNVITISGVKKLNGCFHQTIPDRIEAGTYIMYGAVLGENLIINNIIPEHLEGLISKLTKMGVNLKIGDDYIKIINRKKEFKGVPITTGVYPSFPTDLQQVYVTLLTQCYGTTNVTETIFPDRFRHCEYLNEMGANIKVNSGEYLSKATVDGFSNLVGKDVMATDLRAGAALIFAGLIADGTTTIKNINHVLRGYDNIVEKLTLVGAKIELCEGE